MNTSTIVMIVILHALNYLIILGAGKTKVPMRLIFGGIIIIVLGTLPAINDGQTATTMTTLVLHIIFGIWIILRAVANQFSWVK